MASEVTIDVVGPRSDIDTKVQDAKSVFLSIEESCTRFNPNSALMKANARSQQWNALPSIAVDVIRRAHQAYLLTNGSFDPRILTDLVKSGYDASLSFDSAANGEFQNKLRTDSQSQSRSLPSWQPDFRNDEVLLGEMPIDLGGIGKGFAVERAMEILQDCADGVLINAGGDIAAEGFNAAGEGWRLGVENPWDAQGEPVIVVELLDKSIATSSIRLRSWIKDGRVAHHLIDPRTGEPGGTGLISVSVIADTTSWAEVWSKSLFLQGLEGIADYADLHSLATAWIDVDGNVQMNESFEQDAIWNVEKAANAIHI